MVIGGGTAGLPTATALTGSLDDVITAVGHDVRPGRPAFPPGLPRSHHPRPVRERGPRPLTARPRTALRPATVPRPVSARPARPRGDHR
ncbi:hypothetical protein CRV15_31325 (plasmid) [Streptomyces clavuligerus]|nr:hypothetical protein CRV15_31325 [Streptomyces clavuligerus]